MSFRQRLTGFFVAIVIVPMAIVGFVLFGLIEDNETGKADARLSAQQEVTLQLFANTRERAQAAAVQIAADPQLAGALQRGDEDAASRRAEQLLRTRRTARIVVADGSRALVDVGDRAAVAPASSRLLSSDGERIGTLEVSVQTAEAFAAFAAGVERVEIAVRGSRGALAASIPALGNTPLPRFGDAEIAGTDYRVASFPAAGFLGEQVLVSTFAPVGETRAAVTRGRVILAITLGGFFVLAFMFAVVVSRSLRQQISHVLHAAQRFGAGDLAARVPTVGNDEFAALGHEFNKMGDQLNTRLEELRRERERVQSSVRRLGQAVGSNLDAEALLQLVVQTAVEGVDAEAGRVLARDDDGTLTEAASVGDGTGFADVVREAEQRALRDGRPQTVATDEAVALAHPLRIHEIDADDGEAAGVVSVGRRGRPFSLAETELFHYLAAQAAVSIENVGRHEAVARQSVTDPLTRLANRRRFDEALAAEVERAVRLSQPLGLILLDLDDFKLVNDIHGHQQGDVMLREVARAVTVACREIDIPARYGGEELAVILPGADLNGAFELAERVRRGVEAIRIASGPVQRPLQITASIGVAAVPASATEAGALVAAADTALYRAKRAGKNRSARAWPDGVADSQPGEALT